jgi:hypothetical protein
MSLSRRQAILQTLFGSSGLGLLSFATGVPLSVLGNPRRALAAGGPTATCPNPAAATYLILSQSSGGDPINANVPGTYEDANIAHPADPTMAATDMLVGGQQRKAAAPWASLDPAVIAQTSFFHHQTDTVVHADNPKVMRLNEQVAKNEMLVSMLAAQLAPCLGTVQQQPVSLGEGGSGDAITFEGRAQPLMRPKSLAAVLTLPDGPLKDLRPLRDQGLDRLNAWYKANATAGQANFLDRYAKSQAELRNVSDTLLNSLSSISSNDADAQAVAAVALLQLNVTPVVSMQIPFGGDNHGDPGLAQETKQTVSGVATLGKLMQQLGAANLATRTTFTTLNVFGRTLALEHKNLDGRDHNGDHHVAVMIGPRLKSGVVGGVAPGGGDYAATAIQSSTGAGAQNGDIAAAETFSSMGKTLGVACGLTAECMDANILHGKVVAGALTG